ncbi:MAG TPA: hypothetical protein VGQ42_06025 [Candidatus Dormibacteraeota bacterium]|nr:hypothetical protein [Candidatus Dormibacteraeota bacterium]
MTATIGAVFVWLVVSRVVVSLPGPTACPTVSKTGVVLGMHAGLSLIALVATMFTGWRARRELAWVLSACALQIIAYTLTGLFEYGSYGGFCDFRF